MDKQDLAILKEKLLEVGFEVVSESEEALCDLHMSYDCKDNSFIDVWVNRFTNNISLMLFDYVGKGNGTYGYDNEYNSPSDKLFNSVDELLEYMGV